MSKSAQAEIELPSVPAREAAAVPQSTPLALVETAAVPAVVTPMALIDRALASGLGPETLEKLFALQERWEKNQGRKAFDAAVSEAKAKIPPIIRNATGHNAKKYADFAAIARTVDPILAEHGLSYRFRTSQTDRISVTCILAHRDGHSEESSLSGPPDKTGSKNDIQAIGSTLSYLQRYSLVQALGLASAHDDDGKAAANGAVITPEQIDAIRDLLIEHGKKEADLLKWQKVERIEDIPAANFDAVIAATKKAKQS